MKFPTNEAIDVTTAAERNGLLGQSSHIYEGHYRARCSGVNAQSAYNRRKARPNHGKMLKGMIPDRVVDLPQKLPQSELKVFESMPAIMAIRNELDTLDSQESSKSLT